MPTIAQKIPQTLEFRKKRDAWSAGQGARLRRAWGQLGGFSATEENKLQAVKARDRLLAWGRRREINEAKNVEQSGVAQVSYRTNKGRHVQGKTPLDVAGLAEALTVVTDPFMRAVIRETDVMVAGAASDIWDNWPVYSGASRAALSLVWGRAAAGLEVRFISGAEYTFVGHTRGAWQDARKRWNEVPAKIGTAVKVARI